MSRRTERVASLIRTILAEAIQTRLNDPRIPAITSVTRVEVSADFALARVFVSVLAPEKRRDLCLQALRGSAGHLRWLLGQELSLRKLPTLDFRLDDSLRRGFETIQLIERLSSDSPGADATGTHGALDDEAVDEECGESDAAADKSAQEER